DIFQQHFLSACATTTCKCTLSDSVAMANALRMRAGYVSVGMAAFVIFVVNAVKMPSSYIPMFPAHPSRPLILLTHNYPFGALSSRAPRWQLAYHGAPTACPFR